MAMGTRGSSRTGDTSRKGTGRHTPVWRRVMVGLVGFLVVGGGATYVAYARDMQATRDRLAAGSQVMETRHGPIEIYHLGRRPTSAGGSRGWRRL